MTTLEVHAAKKQKLATNKACVSAKIVAIQMAKENSLKNQNTNISNMHDKSFKHVELVMTLLASY